MRVQNVIDGLRAAGDLHVCLVDSSYAGEPAPFGVDFTSSRIRAEEPSRIRKALRSMSGLPVHVRYRSHRDVRRRVREVVEAVPWDLIWCSRMRMHLVSEGMGSAVRVVDFDDLGDRLLVSTVRARASQRGHLRTAFRNAHDVVDALRWRRLQRRTSLSVEAVCVCNEDDRRYLGFSNAVVIPNGYPEPTQLSERAAAPVITGAKTLLFVGPLTYEPNLLAVEWMAAEALPHLRTLQPDARLVVIGQIGRAAARARRLSDVVFVGRVPDVGAYYAAADVAVTPLRCGGGTRLKVIEALARRVPLVSTSFACSGLGLEPGKHALVADSGRGFAEACEMRPS